MWRGCAAARDRGIGTGEPFEHDSDCVEKTASTAGSWAVQPFGRGRASEKMGVLDRDEMNPA